MFCGQIMTLLQHIKGVAFYLLLCEFMKGFDILKVEEEISTSLPATWKGLVHFL